KKMVYHLALDLETTALYGNEGIITCYAIVGQDNTVFANVLENEADEKELLAQFMKELWNVNLKYPSLKIITYNGTAFDFPMLITRFIELDLLHELARFKKNFTPSKHLDLYLVAKNNILIKSRALKELCEYLGIEYRVGSETPLELWQQHKLEPLKNYCVDHATLLHKIRKKFIELNILERD
ncbi:MAG: ribonuclease H-like domain-containing protein, partial [Candidatus Thermoplasmatota archaeon]